MKRITVQTKYWMLSAAFLFGALLAGLYSTWERDGYGHPYQGVAVALGILSATFAFMADRERRDGNQRGPG